MFSFFGIIAALFISGLVMTAIGLRKKQRFMSAIGLAIQIDIACLGLSNVASTPEAMMNRALPILGLLVAGLIVFTFLGWRMFAPKPVQG